MTKLASNSLDHTSARAAGHVAKLRRGGYQCTLGNTLLLVWFARARLQCSARMNLLAGLG